jgi:sugar fermentation stimulation protein A
VGRANRFACWVEVEGKKELAFLPNSGRLQDLLIPGKRVYLAPQTAPFRKTKFDLLLVLLQRMLVSIDARLPLPLLEEAISAQRLEPFRGFYPSQREVALEGGRIDLLLRRGSQPLLVETKSVTLVKEGRALFPDAPTIRGRRHLQTLLHMHYKGIKTAIAFVIQRPDAIVFSPNQGIDPLFALLVKEAKEHGVGVYAFGCQVSAEGITIEREIPVEV